MRSSFFTFFGFLLVLPVMNLSAAEVEINSVSYQPQEYSVGDRVIMTIHFSTNAAGDFTIPELPIDSEGIIIESLEVQNGNEDKITLVVIFRSFVPGSSDIPVMDFGSFRLEGLTIYTTPLVDSPIELRGLRSQLLLPGTRLYSGLLILFLLVLPFALFFLMKTLIRTGKKILAKRQKKKPYRRFLRIIKKLDTGLQQWDNKAFYILLIDGLKEYLTGKTGYFFNTATTSEIRKLKSGFLRNTELEKVVSLMNRGDLVKFAGVEVTGEERSETLKQVTEIISVLENNEDPDADV